MNALNSIAKRDLLAATRFNAQTVREHAKDLFDHGRYGDAFEFFRKINDQAGVERVKNAVVETGDPEVLWRIEKACAPQVNRDDWGHCGENAMRVGKFRSAAYAFAHIGDAERMATAEKEFKPTQEAFPDAELPAGG